MALKAHPGEVTKAYEDGHQGKQTWEVKIKGKDGKNWKTYYEITTGALVERRFGKERAIAFLNNDNASLGGRPIFLATASAEGAVKVADEIRRLAAA